MKVRVEVDAKDAIAAIDKKIFGIVKAVKGAAKITGEVIASDVRQRLVIPRRINVQDAEGASPVKNPVRLKVGTESVDVVLNAHWISARSKAVFGILQRLGHAKDLERSGLWVDPKKHSKNTRGYPSRSGLEYRDFASHPTLLVWAQQSGRGRQFFKHGIWLSDVAARKVLQMLPVVNRRTPQLANQVFVAVKNA